MRNQPLREPSSGFGRNAVLLLSALLCGGSAQAFEFDVGDIPVKIDNLITVGAIRRMSDRDPTLIGKPNLTPGLCQRRISGTADGGPSPLPDYKTDPGQSTNAYAAGLIPAACATSNTAAITQFVNAPGSFSANGDNGNLNFDKGDIVHATAKITTDLTVDLFGFNVFVRGLYFFDKNYNKLIEVRPDTTMTRRRFDFPDKGKEVIGTHAQFLDYFVSRTFDVADHNVSLKIGNQVLNWGESNFLIANSLNSINPPNQALLRIPGFDVKELFQPVGMAYLNAEVASGVNFETFYQYEFKHAVGDPVGSFFSQSDLLSDAGFYSMQSFSRMPEDPGYAISDPRYPTGRRGFYRAVDTCDPAGNGTTKCVDSAGLLGSASSRNVYRDYAAEQRFAPKDGGQYGAAVKIFLDWLNGGTEVGFYYANYHSRFPVVSVYAAEDTCLQDASSLLVGGSCGNDLVSNLLPGAITPASSEPLPVDTWRPFIEYPENVHMYGLSFNTTLGNWAFSGEYTYRPNLPMQVHAVDLGYAALQPAFPAQDIVVGPLTIPGRRSAVPDFLMTNYRKQPVSAGQYIRGYERMKQGQADVTFLKTVGGGNFLGASQITLLAELGHTMVFNFPDLTELQFNGAGTDLHISSGADGTTGINPLDMRTNPSDPGTNKAAQTSRQNPTTQPDRKGFGTAQSYGYRLVALTRFDNALFGMNVEFLTGFFHDVKGVGPGIGQNFVEGRMLVLAGIRWDYLSTYTGELRYTAFTGGERRDQLRDRDNLLLFLGYQF